ncbi:MAG TPA: serine--tRNA ligase, partial [bacterium]|nr:serine--tRNA ligase [bacterium]
MVDLKLIREQPDLFKAALRKKRADPGLVDRALEADRRRREVVQQVEALRAAQNRASQEIPKLTGAAREARIVEMKQIAAQGKALEPTLQDADAALQAVLLQIPNPPHPAVPAGGPDEGATLRVVGAPPQFEFAPRDHVELGAALDLLDVERGAKVSGSRFYFL